MNAVASCVASLFLASGLAFCQAKPIEIAVSEAKFDTEKCILEWTSEVNDGPSRKFSIDLHKGSMSDGKKSYPLSPEEQAIVHQALHEAIVVYAAESVAWFDGGGKYTKPEDKEAAPLKAAIGRPGRIQ